MVTNSFSVVVELGLKLVAGDCGVVDCSDIGDGKGGGCVVGGVVVVVAGGSCVVVVAGSGSKDSIWW